jgi:hypothetical protein
MWFDYEDDRILVNTASHRPQMPMDPQEPAFDEPNGQSRQPLSLGSDQTHGGEGTPGMGA